MRRIGLILLLLAFVVPAFTQQIREFSTDTLEFINQFEDFMQGLNEEEENIVEEFLFAWEIDSFSYELKEEFIFSANHMLRRRARPSPQFVNYIRLMNESLNPDSESLKFRNWLKAYAFLVSSRVNFNEIQRAQGIVLGMLKDSVIYNLAGTKWSFDKGSYEFGQENEMPVIRFSGIDLKCTANKDSINIYNTNGDYDPINLKWKGNRGIVNWEKTGLSAELVYAELNNYKLEINRSILNADSVNFFYSKYFNSALQGKLQEQCRQFVSPDRALYPKFFSYQSKYTIPELFPQIQFTGGLSMQGPKLVGTGIGDELAELRLFVGDTMRMRISSKNIVIREKSMLSTSASMTIKLESDSIYHPDLQFLYMEDEDMVRFTKGDSYTSGVPYSNSYHKVDMNFEELEWKRGEGLMLLKPSIGRAIGLATFESHDFFNYSVFEEIQGRDLGHPLVLLYRFSQELNGWREFPVTAYAGNIGMQAYQVRHQLMKLSRQGFLYFDEKTDMVTLQDKMFYYLEASLGRTDYDVIYFISRVEAPSENGTLNLSNYDLTIKGIPNIFLSDSQNVVLVPDKNEVIMKRNRNFQFDGFVVAGLLTMYGSNFFFDYDKFSVNLQSIDSLQVSVLEADANAGIENIQKIDNLIQGMTGEIIIDNPQNKSGLENNPNYPIFRSKENSYVYFDDPKIQGGVYKRDEVYFEVYPFEFDSLDNFARAGMQLDGRFESSGLLPPLEQTLLLQKNNSLGFSYTTSDIGLPVFNGLGTIYEQIAMSNEGLIGSGKLEYLTSETYSEHFVFHPDSMSTTSREFFIREQNSGVPYPKTSSQNNSIKWLPNKDQFRAAMQDIPFTMFEDTLQLRGDIVLSSQGTMGKGLFDLVTSSIESDYLRFTDNRIMASVSKFKLKSSISDKFAIATDNVRANIDLSNKNGQFYANQDYTLVEFQDIVYESRLDFFKWEMMDETVEMGLNKPIEQGKSEWEDELNGPRYISKLPSQDSLSFMAPQAIYDYRKAKLNAIGVPYIQVADARIFPEEGNVSVGRYAVMDQITNSGILANYTSRYYELFNSNVSIKSRYNYTASGDYSYLDITGEPQTIHFTKIGVDTSVQTYAIGEIEVPDNFQLSPYFGFRGEVRLAAANPFLTFDGATKILHQCEMGKHWLKFEAEINPDSVLIPVSEQPLTYDMAPTYIGTMITRDSTHVYSTFATQRKGYFDEYISTASGILRFNRINERYELGQPDKLDDLRAQGNYLALDNNSCKVFGDGIVNLQVDYGQVKMVTIGETVQDNVEKRFSSTLMMGLDFHFSELALAEFAKDLDSIQGLQPADANDSFYKKSLIQLVGKDASDKMEADLGLYAEYRTIPPQFNQKLLFSDVKLNWNQITRTYRYQGDITVVKVGDKLVNKRVEAYIELTKRASGDLIDIYLKLDKDNFYYFGYNPGSLQTVSSNRTYNGIVFDLKAGERKLKTRAGSTGYIYSLCADRRPQLFMRRFLSANEQGEE